MEGTQDCQVPAVDFREGKSLGWAYFGTRRYSEEINLTSGFPETAGGFGGEFLRRVGLRPFLN